MLTEEQEYILNEAVKWWNSSEQIFQYTGGPGTGKSYLLAHILEKIGVSLDRIAPMAFTGQAAVVMRGYGLINAKTIHSWLYEPVSTYEMNEDGTYKLDPYFNKPIEKLSFVPRDLENIDLFIIDEGSMVPKEMRDEINSRGKKIIVTGDLNQLPPVFGESAYLTTGKIYRLTQIMRQEKNSPIVWMANQAIRGIPIETGRYGNSIVLYKDELTDNQILQSEIIICARNDTREMVNENYRKNLLKLNSLIPLAGERMICRKNNWSIESEGINLVNGLIGNVAKSPGIHNYDNKLNTFKIDFKPIYTDGLFTDLECDYKYLNSNIKQRKFLKNARYSHGEKLEYAYAITVHSSQGSQFNNGIYVEERFAPEIKNKLNYTAITRFKDRIIYVKDRPKMYYNISY